MTLQYVLKFWLLGCVLVCQTLLAAPFNLALESLEGQLLANLEHADLSYNNGRFQAALKHNDQALNIGQRLDIPEYSWRQFQQRAKILEALGLLDKAMAYRRLAIDQIQRIQSLSHSNEHRQLLEFQNARIEYVKRLLKQTNNQQSLAEVLDIWEGLKLGQITEYLGSSCLIPNQHIRQLLSHSQDTAVIYPVVYDDKLEILLVIGEQIYRFKINHSYSRIAKLSKRLNYAISHLRPEYSRYSKALYQILLQPLLETLQRERIKTLVWVQDKSLLGLPIAALQNAEGRFVIQDYALAISPGLDLLSSGIRKPQPDKLFLVGTDQALLFEQKQFPALPAVDEELNSLSALFPNHLLKRGNYDREKLIRQLRVEEFDIVHIASHSQIGSDIQDSFLLTQGTPISFADLADVIATRRYSTYPLELLTLSACETAIEHSDSGLGLAGLLVNTGARSVLASLWKVDDQASALLMQRFYQHWDSLQGQKHSKAIALQQVQNELLKSHYQHPFYWSSFILIGHWD